MSERFVFTTRYIGDGYSFSKAQSLDHISAISKYLKEQVWSKDDIWQLYDKNKSEVNDYLKNESHFNQIPAYKNAFKKKLDDTEFAECMFKFLRSKKMVVNGEKILNSCIGDNFGGKIESRFSYYTLKCSTGSSANTSKQGVNILPDVIAVPHLNWSADNKWMIALINSFGNDLKDNDHLYLIMHDNDVPGQNNQPFKVLNAKEVYNIVSGSAKLVPETRPQANPEETVNGTANNNSADVCMVQVAGGYAKLTVIVYQHTSNDVVDILRKCSVTEKDVSNRISSIVHTSDLIRLIFKQFKLLSKDKLQQLLKQIDPICSVDLNNEVINTEFDIGRSDYEKLLEGPLVFENNQNSKLLSGKSYFVYSDHNGALLNELMHSRMAISNAVMFQKTVEILREPGLIGEEVDDIKKFQFPLIIKIYKSFFDDWADAVASVDDKTKILNHRNKKAMEENLERVFSFFNNSSIWVRLVDMYDEDAFNTAVAEFKYFDTIGLYDYASAWENLEYNLRIFSQNYLESSLDGHGNFVTPMLYGNETEAREILCENHRFVK